MKTNLQLPGKLFMSPVRYEIPAFQRSYVWEQEEQWEPLWDDVEELAQSIVDGKSIEAHFMGAIVLQQPRSPTGTIECREVIDGQQRLTTLQLLIDAIQEVLEMGGHSEPAKRLAALVVNGEEYRGGEPDHAFKVWPTVVDRDAFRHAMTNPSFTEGERIIVSDGKDGYWCATIRKTNETHLFLEYDSEPGDARYCVPKDSERIMGRPKSKTPNPRKMSHGVMARAVERPGSAASLVVKAHEYFKGRARNWLDSISDETGKRGRAACALEEVASRRLEIVVIELQDSDNPHVIFETLNARGTPLLQSDMVKNKILHDAEVRQRDDGNEAAEAKALWPFDQDDSQRKWWAQQVGQGSQRRPRIDLYLNHWLTLRNRAEVKYYDEFTAFQKYVKASKGKSDTIQGIARDLGELGKIYREVEEVGLPDHKRFLERRKVMNVGQVTPLLLRLLSADMPRARLDNCLRVLESFLVRRVVCGYRANGYGRLFAVLTAALDGNKADNADRTLVEHLGRQTARATLWPDDEELRKRFMTAPLYQDLSKNRLRMVLEGIEEELCLNKAESRKVPKGLDIEHVMPQEWRSHWPLPDDVAGDGEAVAKRNEAIHTIGNLTLVNRSQNTALSNAPWDTKRNTLAEHNALFLNERLVNNGPRVWDETAIEKRAIWLHRWAVKIWPHKDGIKVG